MSGKTRVVGHKFFWVMVVLLFFIAGGCGNKEMEERYGTLFSLGEGMKYRSHVFEVLKPTDIPYPVKINDLYGYSRNTHGSHAEEVTEGIFQEAKPFTQDLGAVKYEGKWGYIRLKNGEMKGFDYAIPLLFDGGEPFSQDLAAVKVGEKYGYIDTEGNMVIQPNFISAHYFSQGLAAVESLQGWFFIDKQGETVIAGPYQGAESFSEIYSDPVMVLAPVKIQDKWGYIDQSGEVILPPIYEEAWAFDFFGKAAVKYKGKWQYINPWGEKTGK